MSIKMKYEQINELCHGCLTEDRTVHRISGEISEMFYGLRNDRNKNRLELALCWECVAFLKKLKVFKARIKTAQCLLMKFIKCYCKNEPVPKLESLSSFAKLHINTFDYEFDEKEKTVFEAQDEKNDILIEYHNKEDVHQTKNLTSEELLTDIKVEYDDTIKEEYNSSNDNDSDYYEPVLKFEVEDSEDKPSTVKKYTRSCTKYQRFATVTRRKDISKKTYLQFAESVSLDRREYEKVLKRDRIRYSYPRMPFKCDECREGYLKKIDLQCHNSFGHSNESTFPYKCADCPTMVTSLEQQEQHWAAAHSKQYKCMICTEVHQSVAEIKKHIRMKHRKNYTCNECGFDCGSLYEFRKHYQMTHERVICDYCNGVFMKKRSLISHIQLFHIPAFCGICNRTYTNHKTYKYHNQITHPELTAGSEVRKELSYCVECDKQYPTEHKYKLHLKQSVKHTKQKIVRVPCPDCGKIFTRTSFMNNHYRLVHLKVTKHYCDQCDKYYTTGYGLRQHIERVHKKIALPKDKMCDLCGRGFASNKILINHRRTHTGERPYKCQYCPAAFAQRTAMKTHEKSQHKNLDLSGQPTGPYEGPIRASGLGALPTSTAGRYTC